MKFNRHERRVIRSLIRSLNSMAEGPASKDLVPESRCGHCGQTLNGASSDTGARASPGMITVCVMCAGINRFRADMALEAVTMADLHYLDEDARATIAAYRTAVSRVKPS